jgi:hypothetical protein
MNCDGFHLGYFTFYLPIPKSILYNKKGAVPFGTTPPKFRCYFVL